MSTLSCFMSVWRTQPLFFKLLTFIMPKLCAMKPCAISWSTSTLSPKLKDFNALREVMLTSSSKLLKRELDYSKYQTLRFPAASHAVLSLPSFIPYRPLSNFLILLLSLFFLFLPLAHILSTLLLASLFLFYLLILVYNFLCFIPLCIIAPCLLPLFFF